MAAPTETVHLVVFADKPAHQPGDRSRVQRLTVLWREHVIARVNPRFPGSMASSRTTGQIRNVINGANAETHRAIRFVKMSAPGKCA